MTAIFKRELKAYFHSMIGYSFLGFFVLITAVYFSIYNILTLSTSYELVFMNVISLFLILVPALTMRLLSEEAKQKTDQLLLTAPVKVVSIVLGKYLAAVCLFVIALLITAIFPIILSFFGEIAIAHILGTYIGFFFLGLCFIAVGLWVSSLTDNQIIAAVGSFAVLFLLFMVENIAAGLPAGRNFSIGFTAVIGILVVLFIYRSTKDFKVSAIAFAVIACMMGAVYLKAPSLYDNLPYRIVMCFSLVLRFVNFAIGILDINAIIYYITFSAAFLYLTVNVIEKRRWS